MTPLPSGTITFLFTDIEGSTQRWERDRAEMDDAVRRHDKILREVIASHGGAVFKTVGDEFCAAFAEPGAAAVAAIVAQRQLGAEDFSSIDGLRVRMALHTGTAEERDGDYFGPTVNRIARLVSLGHGGQILLSRSTASLLSEHLGDGLELRDLGKFRLKDITEPVEVHQLVAPGIGERFPLLRSASWDAGNLPNDITSFVGRDAETAEIAALVRTSRLVTLAGAGGIGKTRLSLHVASQLVPFFDDGVWFVEFAPIADGALVAGRIAETLGIQLPVSRADAQTLAIQVGDRQALLLLDNCEHVVSAAAQAAEELLRSCSRITILATSREPLGIAGEQRYRTPPLETSEAVSLFVERAKAADHRFVLDEANRSVVAEVCRRLDGIALAIELAAARLNVLSLRTLAEKLHERFRVLAGGSRTALPRQRTLRALIDWSYDLLDEEEREVFRRLSVFAGDFSLELAARICGDGLDSLAIVESLVDKSLMQVEEAGDDRRYRLLESIREYARERLREHGEERETGRRHAEAYVDLARDFTDRVESLPDELWMTQAKLEFDNWNAALRWTLGERFDADLGRRLAVALRFVWARLAPADGRRAILAALDTVDVDTSPDLVANLHLANAHLSLVLLEYHSAARSSIEALDLFATMRNDRGVAEARFFAGSAQCMLGDSELGQVLLRDALESFRKLGDRRMIAAALQGLGVARLSMGDGAARDLLREALQVYATMPGAERASANIALNLAEADFIAGDAESALALVLEAVNAHRSLDDANALLFALNNAAAYLCALRRGEEASEKAREAIRLAREGGVDLGIVWGIQHFAAAIVVNDGQASEHYRQAARLLGFVDGWIERRGVSREYTEQREYEDLRWTLARVLGDDQADTLLAEGTSLGMEGALALAAEL